MDLAIICAIYGIPLIASIWFLVNLSRYVRSDEPDPVKRIANRRRLIIKAIIAGLIVLAMVMLHFFLIIAVYDI